MSVTLGTKRKEGGIAETARVIVHALIIALVIRTFLFQPFNIPSGSMEETLLVGDYLFVSKYSYGYSHYSLPFSPPLFSGRLWSGSPQRGDVVVFRLPKDDSIDYIKRVIGLPGDRIQMIDGVLHINGEPVKRERIEDFVDTDENGRNVRIKRWREMLPNGVSYTTLELIENECLRRIDELRAQVELQTQQQRLIAARDQRSKDMLSLARAIGLPAGQEFALTDDLPYTPLDGISLDNALQDAYMNRPDYISAMKEVRAAGLSKKAASAENYPSITSAANYGDIGPNFGNSHGTFAASASVNIPIFQGTRVKADVLKADAALQQKQADLDNLKGRVDQDVRNALFDLDSTSELVNVAKSNMELARETLTESQDRFSAGVTDNIEVVQAQESVSSADQAYISSLYAFNIAKVQLARATGIAEQAAKQYLGGK